MTGRSVDQLFHDRAHAGRMLATRLTAWTGSDAVVCGIPRGGVVVAAEVAHALALPLGVVVVRKLGATGREELAIGAIADGVRHVEPDAVRAAGMSLEQLDAVEARERAELRRRSALSAAGQPHVAERVAIVVDDGVATGETATAACRTVRADGATRVVLATPVAPAGWLPESGTVDEYVCLFAERDFWAVGQFYRDFTQTSDAEVLALLQAGTDSSD